MGSVMIDELYKALYQELTKWCVSMTGNRTLAEDLVQEAFLRALINAELLKELDLSRRRAWMYRTIKNLYIDKKRREAFETVMDELPEEGSTEAQYVQIDDALLLSLLTEDEKSLFVLRYLEGYNSAELGKLFGLPAGTVRSKLSGARKHLRQMLEENSRQDKKAGRANAAAEGYNERKG